MQVGINFIEEDEYYRTYIYHVVGYLDSMSEGEILFVYPVINGRIDWSKDIFEETKSYHQEWLDEMLTHYDYQDGLHDIEKEL